MPRVFAPAPFRWPVSTGTDYPYGLQDIADDTLAKTLIAAGKVHSVTGDPDPTVGQGSFPATLTAAQGAAGGAGVLALKSDGTALKIDGSLFAGSGGTSVSLPAPSGGDDAAAIQAVINAATLVGSTLLTGQYVRVVAQEGATYLNSGLEFKSNVWLDFGNSYIKKYADGSSVITNSMIRTIDALVGGTTYYGNYKNIKITGGVWDTNGKDCPAQIIRFENVEDGWIEDVTVAHSNACPRWAFQIGAVVFALSTRAC
jgi:hypothetical protein